MQRAARGAVSHQASRSLSMASPSTEQSFLEKMFNKSKMPQVPLNEPFPGSAAVRSEAAVRYPTEITTLPSGVRVVSCESNNPVVSVGAFIDAGSRYESMHNSGASHFLEHFAFKSTTNRSDFRLVRDMMKIGANVVCSTSREHTVYAADSLHEHVPKVVEALADVIQNPAFDQQELMAARKQYLQAAEERAHEADTMIMEHVHAAAYHGNTLGLPLYAPAHNVANFTAESLGEHMNTFYKPSRVVVSGVGVDHKELCDMVGKEFDALPEGTAPPTAKAQYTGGEVRLTNNGGDELAHVALAFETADWHGKDLIAMCVLQMMMGGGGSFSAGGPGKGMYSRLYQNVLNQHYWVESANSFNSIFTDSSLFGMYGTASADQAGNLVDVLSNEFIRMTKEVQPTELQRSKNQLKSSVHMQLETRGLQLEDFGRQMLTYGKIHTPEEMCARIDAVTGADVQRVATNMLKTPLTLAAYGNIGYLPRYDAIAARFN